MLDFRFNHFLDELFRDGCRHFFCRFFHDFCNRFRNHFFNNFFHRRIRYAISKVFHYRLRDFFYDFLNRLFRRLFQHFFHRVFHNFFYDFFRQNVPEFLCNLFRKLFSDCFRNLFHGFLNSLFHRLLGQFFNDFFHQFFQNFRIIHNFVDYVHFRRLTASNQRFPRFYDHFHRKTRVCRARRPRKIKIFQTKFAQSSGHLSIRIGKIATQSDLPALASRHFHVIILSARLNIRHQRFRSSKRVHNGKLPNFATKFQRHFAAVFLVVNAAIFQFSICIRGLIRAEHTRNRLCIAAACRLNVSRARTNAKRRFQSHFFHQAHVEPRCVQHLRQLFHRQNDVHTGICFFARAHFHRNHTDLFIEINLAIVFFQQFRTHARCAGEKFFRDFGIVFLCKIHPNGTFGRIHRQALARFFLRAQSLRFHQRQRVVHNGSIHHHVRAERHQRRRHFANAALTATQPDFLPDRHTHRRRYLHRHKISLFARR